MAEVSTQTPASTSLTSALEASTFRRLHPRAYLERFAAEGIRPEGRVFDAFRATSLNAGSISTADGSALVRIGYTTVVCGIKAEIAEPDINRPNEGFLVPNVDLPALCSPRFKPGPPGDEAQVLSAQIGDFLSSAQVLPLSSLLIHPAKSAWALWVDVTCINYDGNVFDAAVLAIIAALKSCRLPAAKYDEDAGRTVCSRTESHPLRLRRTPLLATFGIFDSTHLFADPSSFEESLLHTRISIAVDERGQLCYVSQAGRGELGRTPSHDVLRLCIEKARQRRKELVSSLEGL